MTVTSSNKESESPSDSVAPQSAARARDTLVPKGKRGAAKLSDEAELKPESLEHHDTIPAPTWLEDGPESR